MRVISVLGGVPGCERGVISRPESEKVPWFIGGLRIYRSPPVSILRTEKTVLRVFRISARKEENAGMSGMSRMCRTGGQEPRVLTVLHILDQRCALDGRQEQQRSDGRMDETMRNMTVTIEI